MVFTLELFETELDVAFMDTNIGSGSMQVLILYMLMNLIP